MSKIKTAVVTGSRGQDGSYLCKLLIDKKYRVIALDRRSSRDNNWRHKFLNIEKKLQYEDFDLSEINSIIRIFQNFKIDEFYNLAAQSFVKASFQVPLYTSDVTGIGPLRILETIRTMQPKVKFYQASSSEMFGKTKNNIQDENTLFDPQSPYAAAKLFAHTMAKNYRDAYDLFICNGILFNHESPLRGEEFVTRKITKQMCEIFFGKRKYMELGNLYSKRDWGYAEDYVEAMWKMLNVSKPDDYVIATSKTYMVKDFVNLCAKYLNIDLKWKGKGLNEQGIDKKNNNIIIKINPKYYRPTEVNYLKGSYKKAEKKLGWKPKTDIKKLVKLMIDYDMSQLD